MADQDSIETARLLKEALKLVDDVAQFDIGEKDHYDIDGLEELTDRAKKLKKHRLWKLK